MCAGRRGVHFSTSCIECHGTHTKQDCPHLSRKIAVAEGEQRKKPTSNALVGFAKNTSTRACTSHNRDSYISESTQKYSRTGNATNSVMQQIKTTLYSSHCKSYTPIRIESHSLTTPTHTPQAAYPIAHNYLSLPTKNAPSIDGILTHLPNPYTIPLARAASMSVQYRNRPVALRSPYPYTVDLLKLEQGTPGHPEQTPQWLSQIVTPLSWRAWEQALKNHPDNRIHSKGHSGRIKTGFRLRMSL